MSEEIDQSHDRSHDKIWFIRKSGKVFGPFASAKVRHFLVEEKIDLRDEVSKDKIHWSYLLEQPEVVPMQMRNPEFAANTSLNDDLDPGKKGSLWLPVIVISLLTVAGITASLMLQDSNPENLTDCSAAPAPAVNWNSCNKRNLAAENTNLEGLVAANVVLNQARMSGSSFKNASLLYAHLENADLAYADFTAASLKGSNLHSADLTNAILTDADLRYADLTAATLGGAQINGARLEGAIWINGKPCKAGSVGKCIQ